MDEFIFLVGKAQRSVLFLYPSFFHGLFLFILPLAARALGINKKPSRGKRKVNKKIKEEHKRKRK